MVSLKKILCFVLLIAFIAGCAPATPVPSTPTQPQATATVAPATETPIPTETAVPSTATPEPTATQAVFGPDNFPANVDPLTGLEVGDAQKLNRRPVIVKVQNIPRADRPQYGLSAADIVYEYYTEEGSTRFAAIYLGQDAEVVAPIRSARFFDIHLMDMYKGIFVFGSAYEVLRNRLFNSDFANRLLIETSNNLPAVSRFDPNRRNYLSVNTEALQSVLVKNGIDNSRQNLNGMYFSSQVPQNGQDASQIFARYSIAIYNRWDYDSQTGKYLRFSDKENDLSGGQNEVYEQLTDAFNKEPITADNVVTIFVQHEIRDPRAGTEVIDMQLLGQGPATIARDGKIYQVQWQRLQQGDVLTLVDANGQPFPFKPGNTWFEVMSKNAKTTQNGDVWRFTFVSEW